MFDLFAWYIFPLLWAGGGLYAAKVSIAWSESRYLEMNRKACEEDCQVEPQETMDTDHWVGAGFVAGLTFLFFPLVFMVWVLGYPVRALSIPLRAWFLPPQQKAFEEHVEALDNQKALILSTAEIYQGVCGWEPDDHPDRVAMKEQLEQQIRDQLEQLMEMTEPTRAFDTGYLNSAKTQIKALTAGGER